MPDPSAPTAPPRSGPPHAAGADTLDLGATAGEGRAGEDIFGDGPFEAEELRRLYEAVGGDVTAICSTSGVFGYLSAACRLTLGWEPAQLVGHRLDEFVHPEDLEALEAARRGAVGGSGPLTATCRIRRGDGRYLWTESVLHRVVDPRRSGRRLVVASIRDVTERRRQVDDLRRLALTDPLTGVANRTVLLDRLEQALRRLGRSGSVVGVVYFDLDHFKAVNDSLGHRLGDRLLAKVAERVAAAIRPADTLARVGGDEFVILAEDLSGAPEALALARRVCAAVEVAFELEGDSVACTASAGVATAEGPGHDAEGLVAEADQALYRAKGRGRNRAEAFDEELRDVAVGRLAVEAMVRAALAEGRLCVQYQPIVDLGSGRTVGAEALLRIREPGGLVFPPTFIEVAEDTGLLVGMDEVVLDQSLAQVARWAEETTVPDFAGVAVNVTGRQLGDPGFVTAVAEALSEHNLGAGALSLELTERALMQAGGPAMERLRTIRAMGVVVGLDDFGTGYSSLAYLRQFPLDFLKIDQCLVQGLPGETSDRDLLGAVVDLAHSLGLWVVAEGVETAEQLSSLGEAGCDRAQGFLLGPAQDPDEVPAAIEQGAPVVVRGRGRGGRRARAGSAV